ncbi:MAG: phage major capsid protein [Methanosarcinaceae archaeon]|nr:phage major capsid protein [Methanosarcinaceae archaeon]
MVKFNTIEDMKEAYYGSIDSDIAQAVMKADAPVISSTTGVYNRVYGEAVWELLNNEARTWGVLPKKPLANTGFRVITARSSTLGTGGVAENAALPETVKPTWALAAISLKEVSKTFDMSNRQQLLDDGNDDTIGFDHVKQYMAKEFANHINKMLHGDADTVAGNNIESIDRVCSGQSEESALLTAGDADIYGFDRSASTAYDAYVSHASGVDRAITEALVRTAIDSIEENSGARPNVIITGFDTARDLDALVNTQTRYVNERVNISVGDGGIQTAAGNDVGLRVASFDGIPVIRDKDVTKDTKSRIYFLNTEYIHIGVKQPVQYFETSNFFEAGKLGKEGMYYMAGELVCNRFNAQGKIRDLL